MRPHDSQPISTIREDRRRQFRSLRKQAHFPPVRQYGGPRRFSLEPASGSHAPAVKAAAPLRPSEHVSGTGGDVAPRIVQAMGDAIVSERDELRAQLARYEDLRWGRVTQRGLCSLRGLPVAMIEGRIAARMTQRDLAERLGIPEQPSLALGDQRLPRRRARTSAAGRRRLGGPGARDRCLCRPGPRGGCGLGLRTRSA